MHSPDSFFPSTESTLRNASLPPFQVVRANEHGIILVSQRNFEIGATMEIGFHVNCNSRRGKSKFISVEAIVVHSKPMVSRSGQLCMEITMMFSEMDREDREILLKAPELSQASVTGGLQTQGKSMRFLN